ncbi:MAG TPA: cupin domain-containing protein [Opitutaceae bacterium]|nr:cupin domain-containing protein [Opitutaceae bacterium]
MKRDAAAVIAALGLEPLPHEGGFFRQTWRTEAGSAILYLMTPVGFSALHRLRTDEVWHFHAGDAIEHVHLDPRDGCLRRTVLGPNVARGDAPQLVVPGGVWQGARLGAVRVHGWALLGATLAPPWNERDFELGARAKLQLTFPSHTDWIAALTR